MFTLQFYKNPYSYPDYTPNLTAVGNSIPVTPININSTSGKILLLKPFDELYQVNYIKLTIGSAWLYAFITDIAYHSGDKRYTIEYRVDAFRTYVSRATLGTQFIKRSPAPSNTIDPLLRGNNDNLKEIITQKLSFRQDKLRTLVVQVSVPSTSPSNTYLGHPLQPSPYLMYMVDYDADNWHSTQAIINLINVITKQAKPINLVSIYSIPYYHKTNKVNTPLLLEVSAGTTESISGFYVLPVDALATEKPFRYLAIPKLDGSVRRSPHSIQLIIPEAGIISIPDDVIYDPRPLFLRQDIDVTTGSSNYALYYFLDGTWEMLPYSVRGSAVGGIPLAYSPEQQLMAINQTNRSTSLLGDVAGVAIGGAQIVGGLLAAPATGGLSAGMAISGGIQAGNSLMNIFTRDEALKDTLHTHTNPPAVLGSALLPQYVNDVIMVQTRVKQDNAEIVHTHYGYPQNRLMTLTIPPSGFIQTSECSISGSDIPDWAKNEINQQFDRGIRIK